MDALEHDLNGPFVRSAWTATPDGQTETVYAVRVTYQNGDTQIYSPRHDHPTPEQIDSIRSMAGRDWRARPLVAVEVISREVTVSATPWASVN